jgi:hypothetical protein
LQVVKKRGGIKIKSHRVKNLMAPVYEYATVTQAATLLDAVEAFRKAQDAFIQSRYQHRSILLIDRNNHFLGKLSQHDVIEALEPNYRDMRNSVHVGSIHRLGFSDEFFKSTIEQYHLWEQALENLCGKAIHTKVKSIMYTPDKGEFVNESAIMDERPFTG